MGLPACPHYALNAPRKARRVGAKVEFHFGELSPRVGFIVTNLETENRRVVRFYNQRGTAEQWIKEGKQAVKMTRLSCHRFRSNEVRLWLSVLAYNLGNLWRRVPFGPGTAEEDRGLRQETALREKVPKNCNSEIRISKMKIPPNFRFSELFCRYPACFQVQYVP